MPPTLDVDDLDQREVEQFTEADLKTLLKAKQAAATHFVVGLGTLKGHDVG